MDHLLPSPRRASANIKLADSGTSVLRRAESQLKLATFALERLRRFGVVGSVFIDQLAASVVTTQVSPSRGGSPASKLQQDRQEARRDRGGVGVTDC